MRPVFRLSALSLVLVSLVPWILLVWLLPRRARLRTAAFLTHVFARAACGILGIQREVQGTLPHAPVLVAANHLSYLDILVTAATYPTRFVAKASIRAWPVVGLLARTVGTIFVERDKRMRAPFTVAQVEANLRAGVVVTVFPEGYSSNGASVRKFHASLFEAAVRSATPCTALCLWYGLQSSADNPADVVCWWGDTAFAPHFAALLRLRRIDVRLRFVGSAFVPEERGAVAAELHARVLSSFEPVRGASF